MKGETALRSAGRLRSFVHVPFFAACACTVLLLLVGCWSDYESVEGKLTSSDAINTLCTSGDGDVPPSCTDLDLSTQQYTKFLWLVTDALPRHFVDDVAEHYSSGSQLLRLNHPRWGTSSRLAVLTTWLTGQPESNHFYSRSMRSDNLIDAMVRSPEVRPIRYFGPLPTFLDLTRRFREELYGENDRQDEDRERYGSEMRDPLKFVVPMRFKPRADSEGRLPDEDHEIDQSGGLQDAFAFLSGKRLQMTLDTVTRFDVSMVAHTHAWDELQHEVGKSYAHDRDEDTSRLAKLFEKSAPVRSFLKSFKAFIDANPDYLLVLSSPYGVDGIHRGREASHSSDDPENAGWIMFYNPKLRPSAESAADHVDVAPTFAKFLRGTDIPALSVGTARNEYEKDDRKNIKYVTAALRQNVAQLVASAAERGVDLAAFDARNKQHAGAALAATKANLEDDSVDAATALRFAEVLKEALYSHPPRPGVSVIRVALTLAMLCAAFYVLWPEAASRHGMVIASGVLAFLSGNVLFCSDATAWLVHGGYVTLIAWPGLVAIVYFNWPHIDEGERANADRLQFLKHEAMVLAAVVAAWIMPHFHTGAVHAFESLLALGSLVMLSHFSAKRDGYAGGAVAWTVTVLWLIYRVSPHTNSMFVLGRSVHGAALAAWLVCLFRGAWVLVTGHVESASVPLACALAFVHPGAFWIAFLMGTRPLLTEAVRSGMDHISEGDLSGGYGEVPGSDEVMKDYTGGESIGTSGDVEMGRGARPEWGAVRKWARHHGPSSLFRLAVTALVLNHTVLFLEFVIDEDLSLEFSPAAAAVGTVHASAAPIINASLMLLHKVGPYMLSMVMSSGALPPAEVAAGCVVMLCTAGLGLHFAATGGSSVFDSGADPEAVAYELEEPIALVLIGGCYLLAHSAYFGMGTLFDQVQREGGFARWSRSVVFNFNTYINPGSAAKS